MKVVGKVAIGPADEIASLPALITAPTDPVKIGAANRALERLGVPWRFGETSVTKRWMYFRL